MECLELSSQCSRVVGVGLPQREESLRWDLYICREDSKIVLGRDKQIELSFHPA